MDKTLQKISFVNSILQILLGILEIIDYALNSEEKGSRLKVAIGAGFMVLGALNCKKCILQNNLEQERNNCNESIGN